MKNQEILDIAKNLKVKDSIFDQNFKIENVLGE